MIEAKIDTGIPQNYNIMSTPQIARLTDKLDLPYRIMTSLPGFRVRVIPSGIMTSLPIFRGWVIVLLQKNMNPLLHTDVNSVFF